MSDPINDEILKRVRRLETRVTSFMRYHGFWPGRDLDVERVKRVLVDRHAGEVHVTSPDVPIGNILDAVVTEGLKDGADLYVSGVKAGHIDPRKSAD